MSSILFPWLLIAGIITWSQSDHRRAVDSSPCMAHLRSLSLFNISKIYVLNLARRPDRLTAFKHEFKVTCEKPSKNRSRPGVPIEIVEAVDGQNLSLAEDVPQFKLYPNYASVRYDPHPTGNPAYTMGEIGSALSHFKILQKIIDDGLPSAMVLEDDVCKLMRIPEQPTTRQSIDAYKKILRGFHHAKRPTGKDIQFMFMDGKKSSAYLVKREAAAALVSMREMFFLNWVVYDDFINVVGNYGDQLWTDIGWRNPAYKKIFREERAHFQEQPGFQTYEAASVEILKSGQKHCGEFMGSDLKARAEL